ncbi:MAG: hypothetical protein RMJ56_12105 [Gemmataceae bacterium]|nr:hypothetical protein [Gemmata sp.]MDW8198335.1 hypothetical protein [Gemmataceae bacterium]
MRIAIVALFTLLAATVANTTAAADDSKDLIVGTWVIAYSDAQEIPTGTKLTFTAEGRVHITVPNKNGSERAIDAGGYKLEKDVLTLTGINGQKNDKGRICLLNSLSLIINDEMEDKVMVLKRMKK